MNDSVQAPEKPAEDASLLAERADRAIAGKVSIVCTCAGLVVLGYLVLWPLPWNELPNVFRIIKGSWLFLVISGAVIYSAVTTVARRRRFPVEMVACLVIGIVWK